MSVLYLVRHGQAAFFSDDYDRLTPLGVEQSQVLGRSWVEQGIEIDEVYSGELTRQRQTADAAGTSFKKAGKPWPELQVLPGLDEFGADNVMDTLRTELVERHPRVRQLSDEYAAASEERERYRTFHRLLEALMEHYIVGDYETEVAETWRQFHDRVLSALVTIRAGEGRGRSIAVFTSGGPISVTVQSILEAPELQAGRLNWRIHNASVTKLTFRADRISLDQFNTVGHLPDDMLTYR